MRHNPAQRLRDVQHFGEEGGVTPVIDHAATSTFLNPDDMEKVFRGELEGCYLYSRHSNPSVQALGKKIAAMENMEAAFGVSSGMAAISASVLQIMGGSGHMIASNTLYGGTWALFQNILPSLGIEVTLVEHADLAGYQAAIRPDTKLIYTETLSNPLLALANLKELGSLAKKHGLQFMVDNTFTPMMITPSEFGADVVVYSCTKYISGSSDLIGGAIVSSRAFINQLIDVNNGYVMLMGPVMDARVAYELYARLDHLPLRMKAHSEAAMSLAKCCEENEIPGLVYPGLSSHPHHDLMKSMIHPEYGFGGMMTLDCGSLRMALDLARELQDQKFGLFAVSLGFTRTLMSCPTASTSSEIPSHLQEKMGLKEGLLRLSIGVCGDQKQMNERFITAYKKVAKKN